MQRLWWNLIYLVRKTPWDTGVTPPEVRAVVESGQLRPGRALDLGCGTGTNAIYLARHGFDVIGVDISSRAIAHARRKIKRAGLDGRALVYAGDVARLGTLPVNGLFNLVLDIGCLHVLDSPARQCYAEGVIRRLQPGGLYMVYAFGPRKHTGWEMGLSPEEVEQLFRPWLALRHVAHGQDQGGVASAWYTFEKAV